MRSLQERLSPAVILATGYSLVLAWSLTVQLRPIYSLLLSTLLMVVFNALLGWRAYAERERLIQNLRPFVAHHRLYEGILDGEVNQSAAGGGDINEPFRALCADILEARQAWLVSFCALAPLSGAPLLYPDESGFSLPDLNEVILSLESPAQIGIPLVHDDGGGMVFAVPLWSERGLIGVLLLGEKGTGGWPGKPSDDIGGHGLALHSTMMAVIGGFLKVESAPGQHTRVILELPETAWHSWV